MRATVATYPLLEQARDAIGVACVGLAGIILVRWGIPLLLVIAPAPASESTAHVDHQEPK